MPRAFLALTLSDEILERYATCHARDRDRAPRLRWVRPANVHVTVRFLGDVDEGRLEPLRLRISEAYAPERPFRVSIGPPGSFGPLERPQVLWFALREGAEELGRLVERTEAVVRTLRFEPERKPWKAHVTIARNPQGASWAEWRDVLGSWGLEGLGFDAREITCFESRLGPSGPTYTTLWKAPLGASETARPCPKATP